MICKKTHTQLFLGGLADLQNHPKSVFPPNKTENLEADQKNKIGGVQKPKVKRFCVTCSEEFECREKSVKKTCSQECAKIAKKPHGFSINTQIEKKCIQCGGIFKISKAHSYKKFCTKKCFEESRGTKVVECCICGKTHKRNKWKIENRTKFFCSHECRHESLRSQDSFTCHQCGKIYKKRKSYKAKGNRKFCSADCSIEFHKSVNHPNYKNGHKCSPIVWYGKEWKKTAENIRKRDVVCKRCGKSKEENKRKLDVHHIIPYAAFGPYRQNEAHNESNLIALCRSCHSAIEGTAKEASKFKI